MAIEAVDRSLRDFLDQPDLPFGGITVACGGDFQQTLPIIPKGTKDDIIEACLQRSILWQKIKVIHLTENMRVDRNDPQSTRFAEWLQSVGVLHGDYRRLAMGLLSPTVVMSKGLGFNLCVVPFLNICVLNLPQRVGSGKCWR